MSQIANEACQQYLHILEIDQAVWKKEFVVCVPPELGSFNEIDLKDNHFTILTLLITRCNSNFRNKDLQHALDLLLSFAPKYTQAEVSKLIGIFPAIVQTFSSAGNLTLFCAFVAAQDPSPTLIEFLSIFAARFPEYISVLQFSQIIYKLANNEIPADVDISFAIAFYESNPKVNSICPWMKYIVRALSRYKPDFLRLLRLFVQNPGYFGFLDIESPPMNVNTLPPISVLSKSNLPIPYDLFISYQSLAIEALSLITIFTKKEFTMKDIRDLIFLAYRIIDRMQYSNTMQDMLWLVLDFFHTHPNLDQGTNAFFWWFGHTGLVSGINQCCVALVLGLFSGQVTPAMMSCYTGTKKIILSNMAEYDKSYPTPIIQQIRRTQQLIKGQNLDVYLHARCALLNLKYVGKEATILALSQLRARFPDPEAVALFFPIAHVVLCRDYTLPVSYPSLFATVAHVVAIADQLPFYHVYRVWASVILTEVRGQLVNPVVDFTVDTLPPLEFLGAMAVVNPDRLQKIQYCVTRMIRFESPTMLRVLFHFFERYKSLTGQVATALLEIAKPDNLQWLRLVAAISMNQFALQTIGSQFANHIYETPELGKCVTTILVCGRLYTNEFITLEGALTVFTFCSRQNVIDHTRLFAALKSYQLPDAVEIQFLTQLWGAAKIDELTTQRLPQLDIVKCAIDDTCKGCIVVHDSKDS